MLIDAVLGEPCRYTSHEVAAAAGVPMYRARRFWRALGFANVADDAVEFTDSDIAALRMLLGFVEDGIVDDAQAVQLTRVLGRASARLAGSQVETLVQRLDAAHVSGQDRLDIGRVLAMRLLPELEELLRYTWRRQLAAAVHRLQPPAGDSAPAVCAVGFADLVGFTRLSRRLSDQGLMRLVDRFEGRAADLIVECGGRLIKSLGDEVLFVADDPAVAAQIALRLLEVIGHDREVPGIRVGLALGSVVCYLGDLFGTTVNLANRLTAMTEPNSVLVGPRLSASLAADPGYELEPLGPVHVRGIGEVAPSLLRRSGHR